MLVAESIACYEQALQLKPNFAEAHNSGAFCIFKKSWTRRTRPKVPRVLGNRPFFLAFFVLDITASVDIMKMTARKRGYLYVGNKRVPHY